MFSKKTAKIKDLEIGGSSPLRIQTMWDRRVFPEDIPSVVEKLKRLRVLGLDIVRFSVLDENDVEVLSEIQSRIDIPLVADIHFDYKLALSALDHKIPKVRINPGNIGPEWKSREIYKKASDTGAAVRIGLNSGSLPLKFKGMKKADAMVESATEYIDIAEKTGFDNLVISLKSSDLDETVKANEKLASLVDYPLHLGVTEAGGVVESAVRSTWALGNLLKNGIGDTIRVSITGSLEDEVVAGMEIARALGLLNGGIRIVSCPRCGRHVFDTDAMLREVKENITLFPKKDMTIAIMGCQVNGPGEAESADYAVTGIGNSVFLYKRGKLYEKIERKNALSELLKVIEDDR